MPSKLYLIPSLLDENALATIPPSTVDAVMSCQVFFVENERTARRYLKKISKNIVIDNYEWYTIDRDPVATTAAFRKVVKEQKVIGIISEAGCPGVADPGQELVAIAHELGVEVKPVVGPSALLLGLMASGMNGQGFRFAGYLPIREPERAKAIRDLEHDSARNQSTQIFIETPYRNHQLFSSLLTHCKATTRLCIAADLTGPDEWVRTKTILEWKKEELNLHKRPAIFLLLAGT